MFLNALMDSQPMSADNLISSIKDNDCDGKQNGTIKALIKNFILPETDVMAIKEKRSDNEIIYTGPIKPYGHIKDRKMSINEAKKAFLNSTVSSLPSTHNSTMKKEEPILHYAQIAVTTQSEDARSTGGGTLKFPVSHFKEKTIKAKDNPIKNKGESQQRKVSFKIKNASTSYRRPPIASKTTVTIPSIKVSELTKKFNSLVNESQCGSLKQSKLVKTLEELQSRTSTSTNSTPSSPVKSSPNIKIVVKQRKGSKKRNRKRCSSMDSINKLILSDSSSGNVRVLRSKSDGNKIPKSPKKRLKFQSSSENQSGSDSVDGTPSKLQENPTENKPNCIKVKKFIEKFECEIIAQSSSNTSTLKRSSETSLNQNANTFKEKPKVPEKKSSLVLTKNIVVKNGVPKIKTLKPVINENSHIQQKLKIHPTELSPADLLKKKESIYDKIKYKEYIHSEKLPLHLVEIVQEDAEIAGEVLNQNDKSDTSTPNVSKVYDDVNSSIIPNESFLWRRKSSSQIYSDTEKSVSDNSYSLLDVTVQDENLNSVDENITVAVGTKVSQDKETAQSDFSKTTDFSNNSDFESNLVEAYNKEVLVGMTTKTAKKIEIENDYEPLELREIGKEDKPVKIVDRLSKINCPLPEIPKEEGIKNTGPEKENIYQSLLEMRSHPEGDESSLHSYELCVNHLEERTRGDGDSDDGYEYCKSPIKPYCVTSSSGIQIAEGYQHDPSKYNTKNYAISKSISGTSTVSYEKIGSDRIYEKIPAGPPRSKNGSPNYSSNRNSIISYSSYNDTENIYDTIKHSDATSLSHCYESIPNSPSMVKLRNNLKRQLSSAVQKRLSFDTMSNISQSTLSSEQKTNSIYGQRSVISYNEQELSFQVPSSETSVSDRSDRSDDWVDVSDEEKTDEQRIIIVHERNRGRKSWSQKVREQRQKSPKEKTDDKVFVSSPTKVYINTSVKCSYYSKNDEEFCRITQRRQIESVEDNVNLLEDLEQKCWLTIRTVLTDGEFEVQDLIAFIEGDSSDSGHLYESLEPAPAPALAPAPAPPAHPAYPAPLPLEDDFDSFDSDSDTDDHDKTIQPQAAPALPAWRLPSPPSGGQHTLTKIANAAQKKMRQLKRNLTKKYSVAMDGKSFIKSNTTPPSNGVYDSINKSKTKSPYYANYEKPEIQHLYSNINFNDNKITANKTETPVKVNGSFKEELKTVIGEKRNSNGDLPPPLPEKPPTEKPTTPTSETSKKEAATLSRKTYFSFKSRFRRATSMAVDINSEVPSALKITNSTFYLTDSMDGDSGFSNCSDSGQTGSTETLSPTAAGRRRDGRITRPTWSESSPCLALERPGVPPPPPPAPVRQTDLSAVNEELKRLLPTLSRKDKGPRTRSSWYAECGADNVSVHTSNTSWYAEAGLYQAGNISSSSGASSGSHPASPLPHSLFTHEPLYQFYNAAKVESACRGSGDSDSDAYEANYVTSPALPPLTTEGAPPTPARPSAMALVAPRGPARTLWCEVPEVVNSTVLSSLAPAQKRLQEAKFELLTSEASYLNSLNVLEAHFIAHPAFRETHILPRQDWEALFSTILPVRKCSQILMTELEKCWQENILLAGICDIVRRHAERHFQVYVKYCEHQALMVRALQRLRERPTFAAALKRLESHPACQSLSLHSFLMLPMQRITRLPLLLDAVLKNLSEGDDEYESCMMALATLNNFVSQCNEGARNTERTEEMFRLSQSIEFPPNIQNPPLLGPACSRRDRRPIRWLVRSGEMTHLIWKTDELKLTFGKKFHKIPLYLFLFNDLLVIAKKKGEETYTAVDHCCRSLIEVCAGEGAAPHAARHAILLTLLENHEGRTIEMLMSCSSETDASRWTEALSPPEAGGGEAVYAGWDCPQVAALYAYAPAQPDELALTEGDVVNVTRKTNEGWYYGERTRDGECGWFPGSYTVEIASAHVRARNLRQRYRLLALSGTYLGQKKKPT